MTILKLSVDLLLSRVGVLQRTVMNKHWDELQSLRMSQGRHPGKEHPGNPRTHRRRYEDVSLLTLSVLTNIIVGSLFVSFCSRSKLI